LAGCPDRNAIDLPAPSLVPTPGNVAGLLSTFREFISEGDFQGVRAVNFMNFRAANRFFVAG
jgi:hypothetical protein